MFIVGGLTMSQVVKTANPMRSMGAQLRGWQLRRWLFAAGAAAATIVVVAIPTDMIDTPAFTRDVPVTWWAWPVLIINGILAGLVAATYVARREPRASSSTSTAGRDQATPVVNAPQGQQDSGGKFGAVGAFATFFAVGCPVCNKIVLLALGYAGAIQFFEPIQPYLALGAIALLGWAFIVRVRRERSCPLPVAQTRRGE
jgi:hypothetical protein